MKRFTKSAVQNQMQGIYRSPYRHRNRNKEKPNYGGSAYIKTKVQRPAKDVKVGVRFWDKITIPAIKYDDYIVEFDGHENAPAHIHMWRSDGYQKISGTRSRGIDLRTSLNNGVIFTGQEQRREPQLNNIQTDEILHFVEENRYMLYLMYKAHKMGKVKRFESVNEEDILSLFTFQELNALTEKYKNDIASPIMTGSEPTLY